MKNKNDILNAFFEMEEQSGLFELKYENNPIWDILRAPIYYLYYFPEAKKDLNFNCNFSYFFGALRIQISSFFKFCQSDGENIVLTSSRNIDEQQLYYDKASSNVIESLPTKMILEYKAPGRKYKYSIVSNFITIINSIYNNSKNIPDEIYQKIESSLIDYMGESKITKELINQVYGLFIQNYYLYKLLFKLKKTKRLFYIQDGFQKGYLKAAKELNVKVYELQHGSFEVDHLGYSYPQFIDYKGNILFPDYLLTLGEYWGSKMNIPVKKILSIGNDCFYSKSTIFTEKTDKIILVISSIIHADDLIPLAIELSIKFPKKKICFKLHNNEYANFNKYSELLSGYENINVMRNEKSIQELLPQSEFVLVIASTVVYEALNAGIKVVIYMRGNYLANKNLFSDESVYLIENIFDLETVMKNKACSVRKIQVFFKPFDNYIFQKCLNL